MNLGRLVAEIQDIIQESAYAEADIITRINEALVDIAAGLEIPTKQNLTAPLPNLFTSGTVSLVNTARYGDMPSGFQRGPITVYSSTTGEIPLLTSFRRYMLDYPTLETGTYLYKAILNGNRLYVYPSVTESVTVTYYEEPGALSEDTDEPDWLPTQFHRRLVVNMVCRDIFNRIEDGLEGSKPNTQYYQNELDKAIYAFDLYLGDDGDPEYIEDNDIETEIV
jgi:hypothetical protein